MVFTLIVLVTVPALSVQSGCPGVDDRMCTDGFSCFSIAEACDGKVDCADASDESGKACGKCISYPCMNSLKCTSQGESFSCTCMDGWIGERCCERTGQVVRIGDCEDSTGRGRIEVYHDGKWGGVCSNGWDDNDARVACRQLGKPYKAARAAIQEKTTAFTFDAGPESRPVWLDGLECNGGEIEIAHCNPKWGKHNCLPGMYAGIVCEDPKLRIFGGVNSGRVEVYYHGEWGTVSGKGFDTHAAKRVCHQLGKPYTGAVAGQYYIYKAPPTQKVLMTDVSCGYAPQPRGTLWDCDHKWWTPNSASTIHTNDAGVYCKELEVDLAGGYDWQGRVRVLIGHHWHSVCSLGWDDREAKVVCRQLGQNFSGAKAVTTATYSSWGVSDDGSWINELNCGGNERQLQDCSYRSSSYCSRTSVAGVICANY